MCFIIVHICIYSSDSPSDSSNFNSSLISFITFFFFAAHLHSSKIISGKYSLSELTKIKSNSITNKQAQPSFSLGILLS